MNRMWPTLTCLTVERGRLLLSSLLTQVLSAQESACQAPAVSAYVHYPNSLQGQHQTQKPFHWRRFGINQLTI